MKKVGRKTLFTAKRIATLAVLTAMALIMFMVESLFPSMLLPGAKMGLSNIFSLLAVFVLGPVDAIVLVVVRTTLGSLFTGNVSTLLYSLTAGLVSVATSALLVEFVYPRVSIVAISVVSAVMHNMTQNVVFCLISATPEMFAYMPWLALLGILAGVIVGFAVWFILRAVPAKLFVGIAESTLPDVEESGKQLRNESSDEQRDEANDDGSNVQQNGGELCAQEGDEQSAGDGDRKE